VTAAIQSYTSRDLFPQDYTEVRNGPGGPRLTLLQFPVTAVSSVTVNGRAVPQATTPTGPGWLADDREVYLTPSAAVDGGAVGLFPRGFQNVVVEYEAGYATIPADLVNACVQQVGYEFRASTRIGERSKTLGAAQTVGYLTDDWLPGVLATINRYRRVSVPT
jgi:hypothetical protein